MTNGAPPLQATASRIRYVFLARAAKRVRQRSREFGTGFGTAFSAVAYQTPVLMKSPCALAPRNTPRARPGAGRRTGAASVRIAAERLFRFPAIDRLPGQAARDALELPARAEGVDFERAATSRILELTEGYPYFLQEYGRHVWNVAAGPTITVADVERAHDLVQLDLDESFFRIRIGRATAELAYLAAMAHLGSGPYRSGEIAARLGRPGPESVAPTRARLIKKGLIYSPSYGLNEFTVPQFDAFIRRSFPLKAS